MKKQKPLVKIEYLANWYFGNFCARCAKIKDVKEDFGRECLGKIQLVVEKLKQEGIKNMTHKEFTILIKGQEFCKPIKRIFHECPICKKLGIKF